jgi:hypothetical protein
MASKVVQSKICKDKSKGVIKDKGEDKDRFNLRVELKTCDGFYTIDGVDTKTKIKTVKRRLAAQCCLRAEQTRMWHFGRELRDEMTLGQENIEWSCTLHAEAKKTASSSAGPAASTASSSAGPAASTASSSAGSPAASMDSDCEMVSLTVELVGEGFSKTLQMQVWADDTIDSVDTARIRFRDVFDSVRSSYPTRPPPPHPPAVRRTRGGPRTFQNTATEAPAPAAPQLGGRSGLNVLKDV